jgi:hypothetical protein
MSDMGHSCSSQASAGSASPPILTVKADVRVRELLTNYRHHNESSIPGAAGDPLERRREILL